jgi:hypothetical protein
MQNQRSNKRQNKRIVAIKTVLEGFDLVPLQQGLESLVDAMDGIEDVDDIVDVA